MLRAVRGLEAFSAFTDLIGRTSASAAWVCAFARYPWEYAENVSRARDVFDVKRLPPWNEDDVQALLRRRFEVSGYRAVLEEGAAGGLADDQRDHGVLPRGADALIRMLVDRSDGVPRVALNFWARSLRETATGTVTVRATPVPTADALEALPERSRFVLAALLTQENLTVGEAARVAHFPVAACEIALEALRLQGVLDLAGGRYRVTPFWNPAVVRYLRRKHLVHS